MPSQREYAAIARRVVRPPHHAAVRRPRGAARAVARRIHWRRGRTAAGPAVSHDRTASRRPRHRRLGRAVGARHVLHGFVRRRRLEVRRLRRGLGEPVRRIYFASASIGAIAVSDVESQGRVRRHRFGVSARQHSGRNGPVQVDRRRRDVAAERAWKTAARLRESKSIRTTRTWSTSPCRATPSVPTRPAACFDRRTAGKTWERVLFVNDKTGASDLAMDATNARVLYATMWTGELKPWGLPSTSPDGGVFKTTDGGDHWTKLAGGLPQGTVGRIGVAVSPADSNRVWALVGDVPEGGVFRSDDAGTTFRRVNTDRNLTGRSSYYAHIFTDPKDANVVYSANRDFYKSTDGGVTFKPMPTPHGDDHALWIDPTDPRVMILGNDGGATVSVTGGRTWSSQLNQPTGEMYRVTVDNQVPYRVYGSQQDQYDALVAAEPVGQFRRAAAVAALVRRRRIRRRGRRRRSARSQHRLCQRSGRTPHPLRSLGAAHPHHQRDGRRPRRRLPVRRDAADVHVAARSGEASTTRRTSCIDRATAARASPSSAPISRAATRAGRAVGRRWRGSEKKAGRGRRSRRSTNRARRRACCGPAPTTGSCRCRATTARTGRT